MGVPEKFAKPTAICATIPYQDLVLPFEHVKYPKRKWASVIYRIPILLTMIGLLLVRRNRRPYQNKSGPQIYMWPYRYEPALHSHGM